MLQIMDLYPAMGYDQHGQIPVLHYALDQELDQETYGVIFRQHQQISYQSQLFLNTERQFWLRPGHHVIVLFCLKSIGHVPDPHQCQFVPHPKFPTCVTGLLLTHDETKANSLHMMTYDSLRDHFLAMNLKPITACVPKKHIFQRILMRPGLRSQQPGGL